MEMTPSQVNPQNELPSPMGITGDVAGPNVLPVNNCLLSISKEKYLNSSDCQAATSS